MKKVLLLSLALVFGVTTFAQTKRVISSKAKESVQVTKPDRNAHDPIVEETPFTPIATPTKAPVVNRWDEIEEAQILETQYDLQSNASVSNRMWAWPDGTVSAVATMSNSAPGWSDRGTGYNYYDGSVWGDIPTERVESVRTGWPSIAPLGANGEILVYHTDNNVAYQTRENKGTGEWVDHGELDVPAVGGGTGMTWPRVATSGNNNQYVHIVSAEQNSSATNEVWIYYGRSTDGGQTFGDFGFFPEIEMETYYDKRYYSADCYSIASRGDVVAVLFTDMWWDTFVVKSEDNGETWEKIMIHKHLYPGHDLVVPITDTLRSTDGSGAIAIDANGKVHVTFGLFAYGNEDPNGTTFSIFPILNNGIVYWNEDMGEIPTNPNKASFTLDVEYLESLGMLVGEVPDLDGDGEVTLDIIGQFENVYHYRNYGVCSFPAISIDNRGSIVVAYSVWNETKQDDSDYYLRTIMASYKDGMYGTWYVNKDNLCGTGYLHLFDEAVFTTVAPVAYDDEFWIMYSSDERVGNFVTFQSNPDGEPQDEPSVNTIFAVRLIPGVYGVTESKDIMTAVSTYPNPATDKVTVELNLSQKANNVTISLYNIAGQMVSSNVYAAGTGVNTFDINTTNLETGVYFCTVEVNNYKETKKVVVK